MDRARMTAKDFFLWVGAMIALYVSIFSLVTLFFDYINAAFPDVLNSYIDPYGTEIRYQLASLIVLSPMYFILTYFIRRDSHKDPSRKNIWIRRWALSLTLFAAGASAVVDLITLINTFLGGEITTRFLLKVVVVLLVAALVFLHFFADFRGYWDRHPSYAKWVGWACALLIVCTITGGFLVTGNPAQVRLYRFDDQKVNDLMSIQQQVVSYWQQKQTLPTDLGQLNDAISGFVVPTDPQTGEAYKYKVTGALSFHLCAVFNAPIQPTSPVIQNMQTRPIVPSGPDGTDVPNDTWYHGVGKTCFERTIDPARYPPLQKVQK